MARSVRTILRSRKTSTSEEVEDNSASTTTTASTSAAPFPSSSSPSSSGWSQGPPSTRKSDTIAGATVRTGTSCNGASGNLLVPNSNLYDNTNSNSSSHNKNNNEARVSSSTTSLTSRSGSASTGTSARTAVLSQAESQNSSPTSFSSSNVKASATAFDANMIHNNYNNTSGHQSTASTGSSTCSISHNSTSRGGYKSFTSSTRLRTSLPHLQQLKQQQLQQQHQKHQKGATLSSSSMDVMPLPSSKSIYPTSKLSSSSTSRSESKFIASIPTNTGNAGRSKPASLLSSLGSPVVTPSKSQNNRKTSHSSAVSSPSSNNYNYNISTNAGVKASTKSSLLVFSILPTPLRTLLALILFNCTWLVLLSPDLLPSPNHFTNTTSSVDSIRSLLLNRVHLPKELIEKYKSNIITNINRIKHSTLDRFTDTTGANDSYPLDLRYLRNTDNDHTTMDNHDNKNTNAGASLSSSSSSSLKIDHSHPLIPLVLNGNADNPIHFELLNQHDPNTNQTEVKYKIRLAIDETISKLENVHQQQQQNLQPNESEDLNDPGFLNNHDGSNVNENGESNAIDEFGSVNRNNQNSMNNTIPYSDSGLMDSELRTTTSVPIIQNPAIAALQKRHQQQEQWEAKERQRDQELKQQQKDKGDLVNHDNNFEPQNDTAFFHVTRNEDYSAMTDSSKTNDKDNIDNKDFNVHIEDTSHIGLSNVGLDSSQTSQRRQDTFVDSDEDASSNKGFIPKVYKGTDHVLDDGDQNVLLVIISDRVDGIIPTIGSILQHCSSGIKVDVVLVGEHDVNERVHDHFGSRINQFISLTVSEVTLDLQSNGHNPIWTWPEWHSSINDPHWTNENTIHVADWDSLPTHAHELNHLRFYLPYVSTFQNKGYFYFLDDDVLVNKDLGPVAAEAMSKLPATKGMITPCNIWLWDSKCHHFNFRLQSDSILNMPSLYGDRKVCLNSAEMHCFPESYISFIQDVIPPKGADQMAWNFGFSLLALNNWRSLRLTERYEFVMKRSYELHVFPETSLTFGLGGAYLAFAGAVECWDERQMVVRDGFAFIEWNRFESTFGHDFYEKIDVAHYTGPEKPWTHNATIDVQSIQPWLDAMAKERLPLPDQLPTEPSHNLFTLLASDRTGAQWMMQTLDSHPNVCASGESDKPETGFSSDILLPTGLPWYPSCSIKRGCTFAFIQQAVHDFVAEIPDKRMRQVPRRCMPGFIPPPNDDDPYNEHLDRLCKFVEELSGDYSPASIARLWVRAFVAEDKNLLGCSCPRGTIAKGLKVEPEWLTYENFPDDPTGPPKLVMDDSLLHGSKIIRLKRTNLWARYKSLIFARKSGQYHYNSAEAKKIQEQHNEMIVVSIEDMEWSINKMIEIDRFGDEWAKKHASEVLWIEYESCRDNTAACFKQIFEFLGVDPTYVESNRKRFESAFAALHLDESLTHIRNSDVVREALLANGWSHFIDSNNLTEVQLLIYDSSGDLAKPFRVKGINTTLYGHNIESDGHGDRFNTAVPFLQSLPESALVVLSDDRDVRINYPIGVDSHRYYAISEFRKAFLELTKRNPHRIIVSAESECCASALTHSVPGDYFDTEGDRSRHACKSGTKDCMWEGYEKVIVWQQFMKDLAIQRCGTAPKSIYLDAGLIVGRASDLLLLIKIWKIEQQEDNRAVLTDFMYRFPDLVMLDYGNRLFSVGNSSPRKKIDKQCVLDNEELALKSRYLEAHVADTNALFVHSPRDIGCHPFESSRIQRFPSWGNEGIQLRPILEHFGRVLSGKGTVVLPPANENGSTNTQSPEIPYVLDGSGLFATGVIRNLTDDGTFEWRLRPTEALFKLAYRILKRVRAPVESLRWKRLLQSVNSGEGFPFWAWYGDFRFCNKNNYHTDSIPVFTANTRSDCSYSFPIPNYVTIIDTQRNAVEWLSVFRQFEKQYPRKEKITKAVWRGSLSVADSKDIFTSLRWRLCKTVHELHSDLYDVGLTSIPKHISDTIFVNVEEVGGLAKEISPMVGFMNYAVIIDMDGMTWSSRFGSLLCFNSVVIKVEPTFLEYFFPNLLPWTHYIPVKRDLSDLDENVKWALDPANEVQVQAIIDSANRFCAERFTPTSLANDLLDTWESYLQMLEQADNTWSQKWSSLKGELFSTDSVARMVAI